MDLSAKPQSPKPRPIQKLEETVVNRIAAGEIIHRPANALKELIENSLDAGSTNIQITIKDGGLKLLQIQDNGHGIRREDMAIVCERFTTSKLKSFEDLSNISTYGFRGEALASITHVAHVTITTKTADSNCAYRAHYSDGILVPPKPGVSAEPKPCAGNNGTQITAEDLFYNVPARRKAMKNFAEEYNQIMDIVNRYAIHNAGVSFTCKKQGSNQADINTLTTGSTVDNIRQVYGVNTASELLEINKEYKKLEVKLKGYISNANYSLKKMVLLLFVNHRAVENSTLKKMIESVYSSLLPKHTYPFLYLSLEINPKNVDVNVHPTKREVLFLHEDKIIGRICDAIQENLACANSSRSFHTQTLLPGAATPSIEYSDAKENQDKFSKKSAIIYDHKLVRTDSHARTLDNFYEPEELLEPLNKKAKKEVTSPKKDVEEKSTKSNSQGNRLSSNPNPKPKRKRIEVRLSSILNLRKQVKEEGHQGLTDLLANHTLVGCVDDKQTLALVQHQLKLYLLDYNKLSEELFYQLTLQEFCNFGTIHLSTPAPINDLIIFALENIENDEFFNNLKSKDEIAQIITGQLIERREMLQEYFAITISEKGELTTLPLMLKGYAPNMDKLPTFLLHLGTEVDWTTEIKCFETLAREIGYFYATEPPEFCEDDETKNDDEKLNSKQDQNHTNSNFTQKETASAALVKYRWEIEHLIFPALKNNFIAPKSFATGGQIIQVANLPALYRIFERC
ncbi:7962_t:CDS:10 [Ambispora leptoticha]|uniref:7962_t:CDS:1 n=1 Tax=Ambispora leptoticha TaxID=144679 RepID=A0A9N8WBZ2_9GLOM|nr:7962_t:CDS:10 [Ambispora leptoticha]